MNEAAIRDQLREVTDPDLEGDIVSGNLVNEIQVDDGVVEISLALGAPYSPAETAIADRVRDVVHDEFGDDITVELSARTPNDEEREEVLPGVKNVIAVASGKGGVGKSTVAVNLAAGLSAMGARVGLLDADVYGPNVPRMVDADEPPRVSEGERLVPPERFGVKLMSMAFLVGKDDPVIWRGPVVHKVLTQLVEDVVWGGLDYLVVDLPPGTGDTQLTMLQTVPLTGAVIVTTPQDVAIDDARKGLEMFGEHDTPVLGVVENMSTFVCPDCDSEHDVFGSGGGEAFADETGMPFLGSIPLDPAVRASDTGSPVVLDDDRRAAGAVRSVTSQVADNVGILNRRELR